MAMRSSAACRCRAHQLRAGPRVGGCQAIIARFISPERHGFAPASRIADTHASCRNAHAAREMAKADMRHVSK